MNAFAHIRKIIFHMSQAEFAAAVSVNQSTVSRWERDELQPSVGELAAIRRLAVERDVEWSDRWFFDPAAPAESEGAA